MTSSSQHVQAMGSTRARHRCIPAISQSPNPRRGSQGGVSTDKRRMAKRPETQYGRSHDRLPARIPAPAPFKRSYSVPRSQPSTKYRQVSDFPAQRILDHRVQETKNGFRGREISEYISSHSRSPLTPCLSAAQRVFPSISQLSPGGSQKLLEIQTSRPSVRVRSEPRQPSGLRKTVRRDQRQEDQTEILSSFLKNNGGYLDDSEDEDEEQEPEAPKERSFLTRLAYPFEFRLPTTPAPRNSAFLLHSSSSRSSSNSCANSNPRLFSARIVPTHLSQLPIEKALSLISQKYN